MKKVIIASFACFALASGSAVAADLAVKAPLYKAPPMVESFSWAGWYIGANGGGGFGSRTVTVNEFTTGGAPFVSGTWPGTGNFGTLNSAGGFGGGQVGYNMQTGSWVYGLEADIEGSGIRGSQTGVLPYISGVNTITAGTSESLRWFGTVRGRLGFAADHWLLYATGGFAYGGVNYSLAMADTFGFSAASNTSPIRGGYVVGGGIEYAFTSNWTAKVEYQYINLGTINLNAVEFVGGAPSVFTLATSERLYYHTFRFGLNYKFGGPVVARY